jgi:hypothetical protein
MHEGKKMLNRLCQIVCGLLIATGLVGCGGGELPYTDNSKDSASFAIDMKRVVLRAAEDTKKSPQPADTIRVIVQTLSELDKCPTGEYLKTYQDLHAKASELLQRSENGKPSDLSAKLKEIVDLANTLPGEVTIEKEGANR